MIDKKKYPRLYEWLSLNGYEKRLYGEKYEFQIRHQNLLHSADVSFRKMFFGDNKEIHQIEKKIQMKSIKKLYWYVQNGKTISKKTEDDEDHVWGRLMEYFNGNWQKTSKYYRSHLGMTNENIHKINENECGRNIN